MDAHETQEPAGGGRQTFAPLFPMFVHSAAFPCGGRTQEHLAPLTVAQPRLDTQASPRRAG